MLIRISVFLVAVLLLIQGCSPMPIREWPVLEGRVLDAQTEEPIEDAFVVARWIGYGRFSDSQCFHVEVAETDARGRYRISLWHNEQDSAYLSDQRQTIERVHAPGYRESSLTRERASYRQGVYYLEKDERGKAERLEYLMRILGGTRCGAKDGNDRSLHLFYRALYEEGDKIATNQREKEIVDTLRYWSGFVLFDPEKPSARDEKGRLINIGQ